MSASTTVLSLSENSLGQSTELPSQSLTWDWQKVVANTVNDVASLERLLKLPSGKLSKHACSNEFALKVPHTFIARMQPGVVNDPLLLQVLPSTQENEHTAIVSDDPLLEQQFNVCSGLLHKYQGRVLLTAAVSCPINCRYCFRRHFPYDENRLTPSHWQTALDYIKSDQSIREVILSGGEPLLLNNNLLDSLLTKIESIKHVKLIRIHTRFPIAVPQRVDPALCERLIQSRCRVTMVMHSNHPNEIDSAVKEHLSALVNSPVTLLNQSVLLHGINDDVETLVELSERLFDAGVLPYYLHATDPVRGAGHFIVDDTVASQLALELTRSLPGYLAPTLVREVAGEPAKTRLNL